MPIKATNDNFLYINKRNFFKILSRFFIKRCFIALIFNNQRSIKCNNINPIDKFLTKISMNFLETMTLNTMVLTTKVCLKNPNQKNLKASLINKKMSQTVVRNFRAIK
jgi:hypothetical protein